MSKAHLPNPELEAQIENLHFLGYINQKEYKLLLLANELESCSIKFNQLNANNTTYFTWSMTLERVIK